MTKRQKFGAWARVGLFLALAALFAGAGTGALSACIAFPFAATPRIELAICATLWLVAAYVSYELLAREGPVGSHLPSLRSILAALFLVAAAIPAILCAAVAMVACLCMDRVQSRATNLALADIIVACAWCIESMRRAWETIGGGPSLWEVTATPWKEA